MIAMALACGPKLLIADEPTTALDVTIQAQILDLLLALQPETGMGLVLITHDMGVVAETAHRVVVQYAGQQVERQPVRGLFADPHHPYTAALLAALPERATGDRLPAIPGVVPGPGRPAERLPVQPALRLRHRAVPQVRAAACSRRRSASALCHYPRNASAGGAHERGHRSRDLARNYAVAAGRSAQPATVQALDGRHLRRRAAARRWRWSASPAAASRRWRGSSP